MKHKEWLPRYEEWKKTANEMGLNESANTIVGDYRNHHVKISEIDEGQHELARAQGDDAITVLRTHCYVEFENQKKIMMRIRKNTIYSRYEEWGFRDLQHIRVEDPDFDHEFIVKGNNENAIKSILDSSLCNKIIHFKNVVSSGHMSWRQYTINYRFAIEVGCLSSFGGKIWSYGTYPSNISITDLFPNTETSNLARYIDPRPLSETKGNAVKFKLILDTLIDIVEKLETNTSL